MNRLLAPRIVLVLAVAVLIGRLYQLQLLDNNTDKYRYSAMTRYLPVRPVRGEVFASDGKTLLSESVPIFTVSLRPADLDQAASRAGKGGPALRDEVYARLGQMLGITATLTISPSVALERQPGLRQALEADLGADLMAQARLQRIEQPLRITVTPSQKAAALDLIERYRPTVLVAGQPAEAPAAELDSALSVTSTLVITPLARLQQDAALRDDVRRLIGDAMLSKMTLPPARTQATIDVPPRLSMAALRLGQTFTTTLRLRSPIAQQVAESNQPGYRTVVIKRDIPREVALVLRENALNLPGVVVEYDYRRNYPLSNAVPSLSHLLGYIGRIDACELVRENPARSWSAGLFDSIGHAVECRDLIEKQVRPQLLGRSLYLEDDRIGKEGVEASYEENLRGSLGLQRVIIDASGRPLNAPELIQPAVNGGNLVLTIDAAFQKQVEEILKNWIAEGERRRLTASGRDAWKRDSYQPIRSGSAVVLEVKTGRVLAMVSWPGYDNNIWVDPTRSRELTELLSPPPERAAEVQRLTPLLNRSIAGRYPAGSTLKQFDALIALQNGAISPETRLHDPGRLVVKNQYSDVTYVYPNASNRAFGDINVSDALLHSSNVFFMSVMGGNKENVINLTPEQQTMKGLPLDRFIEGLGWFGLGQPSGIHLPGEAAGRVPTPKWKLIAKREQWTTGDTYNMSIGQGNLLVTPLQLAMAGAAVANGGTIYRPQIVRAITDENGKIVREIEPEPLQQAPVDPVHYPVVREGMRRSVTEGPNRAARDECSGLQIAGKTGTAEFGAALEAPNADGRGTHLEFQTHSWFVGFAPYNDPQIQVVVLSEGTGSLGDGSATIAVPAVTQIMQAYFNIAPPNPLPAGCQQGLPPLPPRPDLLAAQ
ncbi:MAG TPA: penicillin-binding transpeptidase domain-containing protein [Roseiflexaceae bacterium]|nr:penicillin-binding transpeptidase domain-containing protein [Roseiflexaceae bacterium]